MARGLPHASGWIERLSFSAERGDALAAVVTAVLSAAVYLHGAVAQQQRIPPGSVKAWRERRYLAVAALIATVTVGWLVARQTASNQEALMREQILIRCELAAASVETALVRDLQWSESDVTRFSYEKLKALMISLRRANRDFQFALLAGLQAGRSYFLVDSELPESPDYSPPGQPYDEADAAYLRGMSGGRSFVLGPITDRWGTWVIASVPVAKLADGGSVNFELNVAAANGAEQIRRARLPGLPITLSIGVLILGGFQAQEAAAGKFTLDRLVGATQPQLGRGFARLRPAVRRRRLLSSGQSQRPRRARFARRGRPWPAFLGNMARSQPSGDSARHPGDDAGPGMSFDAEYIRPDQRRVTWRVATNPLRDDKGSVCNIVCICVDLTERSQAAETLRLAKEAAEATTQAKSEFLAVMSHELRTPLAGVIGMLDLLRHSPPTALRRQYTTVARDSAGMLMRILDDILDMAKIEAGRLSIETIPFRIRREFLHLSEVARLRAETTGVEFISTVDASVPDVLLGDTNRLRQVLTNLQNNALKFTEKGRVSVRIHCEPLDATRVELRLTVQDTGVGISKANRDRLFAKFEQGDLSTTRRFGGTGLGLSIVKALADAMQGSAAVESELGQGPTFTFKVPLEIGRAADMPIDVDSRIEPPSSTVRLKILCAEDDAVNRMVVKAMVTRMGHHIDLVEDGERAVERLMTENYDLVLMDSRMPVMDGFQATRLIRSGTSGVFDARIYICAATANVAEADRVDCRECGMDDYVKKPLNDRELSAALLRATTRLKERGLKPVLQVDDLDLPPHSGGLSEAERLASLDHETSGVVPGGDLGFSPETMLCLKAVYWEETPPQITALRGAFERGDCRKIREVAHALKSASRYIGADHLSELLAELEKFAAEHELAAIAHTLQLAEAEFDRLRPAAASPSAAGNLL